MSRADDAGAALPRDSGGLDRRRVGGGALLLVAGLIALVVAREPVRRLDYAVPVLLVLLLVVGSALLGGLRVALPGAVAGVLVLNWFFTPPFGTLWIEAPEQVVVLVVLLLVAAGVSSVVDVAARHHVEALRARAEAQALSGLVGAALAEHRTLADILGQVRQVFGTREAALLERTDGGWTVVEVERRRRCPDGRRRHRADRAVGARPGAAGARARAVRGRPQGAGQLRRRRRRRAARPAGGGRGRPRRPSWPRPTGCAPRCWPGSATTCGRRWRP